MHTPQLPQPTPIPAAAFWDAYFENRLVDWKRGDSGCLGLMRGTPAGGPAALASPPPLAAFTCDFQVLAAYDTRADGRFARLAQQPRSAPEVLAAMIDGSYPYREPAPFGKQRMSELLGEIRARLEAGREARDEAQTRTALATLLVQLVEGGDTRSQQAIAALVFLLGELRDGAAVPALLSVVRNADGVPFAKRVLHFTAVAAAYAALWKVNGKAAVPELLVLMRDADGSARQKMAALFERLFSTGTLLGAYRLREAYLDPAFWAERLQPMLPPAAWQAVDARNVFWELRWLAALHAGPADAPLLALLERDEVGLVRATAAARRNEPARPRPPGLR